MKTHQDAYGHQVYDFYTGKGGYEIVERDVGLFGSFKRARWLLRRFHRFTSPNARIIAGSRDPHDTNNPFHSDYHKLNRRRSRMSGQLRIRIRYQSYATPWFDYLIGSPDEMKKILAGTGWRTSRFLKFQDSSYTAIIEKE